MKRRMLRRDFSRNKAITTTLFLFILLAALLISLAAALITQLFGAMDNLFVQSAIPHFVQMHNGETDHNAIADFAAGNDLVSGHQTVEMLNVPGQYIVLGDSGQTQASSVMEIAFVTQNENFDYLLDTAGDVAAVAAGQVGVPVYFMQENDLQIGDTVQVDCGDIQLSLTISCFVRDAMMNPSVVTSKRFLINEADYLTIQNTTGTSEYLIEFMLTDVSQAGTFEQQYIASVLPQNGTALTYPLFQLLGGMSDGLVAAVLILIGLLLVLVVMLCLRYTIMGAMEEDTREIGIMKAIGLSARGIRSLYMTKYTILSMMACAAGFLVSIPAQNILTGNITLYMGAAPGTVWNYLLPLIASAFVTLLVYFIVRVVLRRLRRLTSVDALRTGTTRALPTGRRRISLRKQRKGRVNRFLAIQDVWLHLKSYGLLCFIFAVCAFLAITPMNIYSTISAPQFINYMGAGISDLRIDIQNNGDMAGEYARVLEHLEQDEDIWQYAAFVTGTFPVMDAAGNWTTLKVESGDFTAFPVEYTEGSSPQTDTEIALSAMNAEELDVRVGDTITLLVADRQRDMTVCGIYQDVTNGGLTAKAHLPVHEADALWYVVSVSMRQDVDVAEKQDEYSTLFSGSRVMDMADYLNQTLGSITSQIGLAAILAVVVALILGILITAMFFTMLLAKDAGQSAIMKSLGFTNRDLNTQYLLRALAVLLAGIVSGTLAAGVLGQKLAGLLLATMGASHISFVVNPFISYLLIPALLVCGVGITCVISSSAAGKNLALRPLLTE